MSKRKTRERQLARYQAKREAERRHKRRQRITAAIVALAVGLGGTIFAVVAFTGGDEPTDPNATPSATASPSATPSESPSATPTAGAPAVACGARKPQVPGNIDRTYERMPVIQVDLDRRYIADVETSCGRISLELFPRQAPYTVNSFVFLAERDYFDGLVFHRIANTIDVIQGGNPQCTTLPCDMTRQDGPGYSLPDEIFNRRGFEVGALAMANAGPNTGGSQFFIITGELGLQLPSQFTVFGQILEGLDVARRIQDIPVEVNPATDAEDLPSRRVYIEDVTIRSQPG